MSFREAAVYGRQCPVCEDGRVYDGFGDVCGDCLNVSRGACYKCGGDRGGNERICAPCLDMASLVTEVGVLDAIKVLSFRDEIDEYARDR